MSGQVEGPLISYQQFHNGDMLSLTLYETHSLALLHL